MIGWAAARPLFGRRSETGIVS